MEEIKELYINGVRYVPEEKQQSVPNKDWEIVSLASINDEIIYFKNGKSIANNYPIEKFIDYPCNTIKDGTFKIHSVRRISDNEVFTVGDCVLYESGAYYLKIAFFQIRNNDMFLVNAENNLSTLISGAVKINHKQPLFTTQDNKPIYEGDRVWFVDNAFNVDQYDFVDMGFKEIDLKHFPDMYKYFTTKEAAEEYILMNKPCLSLNDVVNASYHKYTPDLEGNVHYNNLKELVKEKIKI